MIACHNRLRWRAEAVFSSTKPTCSEWARDGAANGRTSPALMRGPSSRRLLSVPENSTGLRPLGSPLHAGADGAGRILRLVPSVGQRSGLRVDPPPWDRAISAANDSRLGERIAAPSLSPRG